MDKEVVEYASVCPVHFGGPAPVSHFASPSLQAAFA